MTDVELDERVTALEENGGGGTQNGRKILLKTLTFTFVNVMKILRILSK